VLENLVFIASAPKEPDLSGEAASSRQIDFGLRP
jgi:hypothetical protein